MCVTLPAYGSVGAHLYSYGSAHRVTCYRVGSWVNLFDPVPALACIVERPLMASNCLLSSLGNTRFIMQLLHTYDSSSLDKVGVKEIGRKSDPILPGGWTLGTGMTSACFHSWEKNRPEGCIENTTNWFSQMCRKFPQKPIRDLIATWWVEKTDVNQLGFYARRFSRKHVNIRQ